MTTGDKIDSCYDCPKKEIISSPSDIEYYMRKCSELTRENKKLKRVIKKIYDSYKQEEETSGIYGFALVDIGLILEDYMRGK